jgi:DNA-binding helix-hairpin-helix protein with protein kinase domain
MEDPHYITDVKSWMSYDERAVVAPAPPVIDVASARLCRGCGEPLPDNRKMYHSNVCKGAWVGRQNRKGEP